MPVTGHLSEETLQKLSASVVRRTRFAGTGCEANRGVPKSGAPRSSCFLRVLLVREGEARATAEAVHFDPFLDSDAVVGIMKSRLSQSRRSSKPLP